MATEKQGTLFPPMDNDNSESSSQSREEEVGCASTMPQPLRDRFATVRALLRSEHEENMDAEARVELKRKQRHAALDTAMAVHREVSRLESAIAELEALRRQQEIHQNLLHHRVLVIPNEGNDDETSEEEEEQNIALQPNWDVIDEEHNGNDRRIEASSVVPSVVRDDDSL